MYRGDHALDYLEEKSYNVSGEVNGQIINYPYTKDASSELAYDYGLKNAAIDPLLPMTRFNTEVVFDVNPDGKNWIFHFTPYISPLDINPSCSVDVPLVQ